MKDYEVIVAKDFDKLEALVNKRLEDGYILVGGISVALSPEVGFFASQAVVKPITAE